MKRAENQLLTVNPVNSWLSALVLFCLSILVILLIFSLFLSYRFATYRISINIARYYSVPSKKLDEAFLRVFSSIHPLLFQKKD